VKQGKKIEGLSSAALTLIGKAAAFGVIR
jgi:hypothetical protein